MSRYIDADNLIDYIRTLSIWSKTYEVEALRAINELLNQIQTADVRENVKGFWYALEKGNKGYSAGDFKCSICGEPNHTWIPKPNYCPNCGAEMRGEDDER